MKTKQVTDKSYIKMTTLLCTLCYCSTDDNSKTSGKATGRKNDTKKDSKNNEAGRSQIAPAETQAPSKAKVPAVHA